MPQPVTPLRFKRLSFRPKDLFYRLLTSLRLPFHPKTSFKGADPPSRANSALDQSKPFPLEVDLSLPIDPGAVCDHLVDLVHCLQPLLPSSCKWLEQGALEVVGEYPIDAGGVADVWVGKMGDRKVAIKAYRCYSSSNYLSTYVKFYQEALAYSRLKGGNVVPFIGVYSTPKHPLALVFEFMDHNLGEYLRDNEDIGRHELLLEIARGVKYMHKLNIVHGNLKITNILIDSGGHARIAGLGAALFPSAMSGVDIDRFFHGTAPELVDPQRFQLTDTGATTASDVYAFGVLAWEVFAGHAPFSDEGKVAGVYSMLKGRRPARPGHPELSDRAWKMINGCWKDDPAQRTTITEAITLLETEINVRKY